MARSRFPTPSTAPTPFRGSMSLATIAHLGGLITLASLVANYVVVLAIVPAALVLALAKRDDTATRAEARAALNFQITAAMVIVVFELISSLVPTALWSAGSKQQAVDLFVILLLIITVLAITTSVFCVLAAVRLRRGGGYRYRFSIRFLNEPRTTP